MKDKGAGISGRLGGQTSWNLIGCEGAEGTVKLGVDSCVYSCVPLVTGNAFPVTLAPLNAPKIAKHIVNTNRENGGVSKVNRENGGGVKVRTFEVAGAYRENGGVFKVAPRLP